MPNDHDGKHSESLYGLVFSSVSCVCCVVFVWWHLMCMWWLNGYLLNVMGRCLMRSVSFAIRIALWVGKRRGRERRS
ncbi:hypothetical protein QBC40DRAFT_277613 [Triangularia verruculosa]|uniref:Transmembrane protein n=1 Tax=Triangularia verruculosa TaxID=2587418 RepID=A0AAN6XK63_9PEZI|nr:hypothetical protein QBC40DRAFT_277613 [Triangularia verruculosa]